MRETTINDVRDIASQAYAELQRRINLMEEYVKEHPDYDSFSIRCYVSGIKDTMNSFHLWVNNSMDDYEDCITIHKLTGKTQDKGE